MVQTPDTHITPAEAGDFISHIPLVGRYPGPGESPIHTSVLIPVVLFDEKGNVRDPLTGKYIPVVGKVTQPIEYKPVIRTDPKSGDKLLEYIPVKPNENMVFRIPHLE